MQRVVLTGAFLAGILAAAACVGDDPVNAGGTDASVPTGDASPPPSDASTDAVATQDGAPTDGAVAPVALRAVAVSAGSTHSCALLASGDVACWGSNGNGELGTTPGALPSSSVPVRVTLPSKARAVAAGNKFTCALLESKKVVCWGNNDNAQLGRSPFSPVGDPKELVAPPVDTRGAWDPIGVSVGGSHACVTSLGGPSPLVGKDINTAWCWGANLFRQLQRTSNGFPSAVPLLATQDAKDSDTFPFYIDRVVAGGELTCAESFIPIPSGVFIRVPICWGATGSNQTGKPLATGSPLGAPSFGADNFLSNPRLLSVGSEHACTVAVNPTGGEALFCWGRGTRGAIGTTTTTLADGKANRVGNVDGSKITLTAAGGDTTCVVVSGTLRCMGANGSGQLGDGTLDAAPHPTFSTVEVPPTVSHLSVGGEHACVVLGGAAGTPGEVRCWGSNRAGQLGDGLDLNAGYTGPADQKYVRTKPVAVLSGR